MRLTRIDFEGRHTIKGHAGHWYAAAQRRDGMNNGPDIIEVTIIAPDTPNGRGHYVDADSMDDIWSMAVCLHHHLEGDRCTETAIQDYFDHLLKLSNCC